MKGVRRQVGWNGRCGKLPSSPLEFNSTGSGPPHAARTAKVFRFEVLSTHTDTVLVSCVHAAQQFAHRNAESSANGQQGREGRNSFAPLDQADGCSVQAAMIGESLLAESLFVPQLPHSLAQRQ